MSKCQLSIKMVLEKKKENINFENVYFKILRQHFEIFSYICIKQGWTLYVNDFPNSHKMSSMTVKKYKQNKTKQKKTKKKKTENYFIVFLVKI